MINENFINDLVRNIKARQTLQNVVADDYDQERLERHLEAAAHVVGRNFWTWNMIEGINLVYSPKGKTLNNPELNSIDEVLAEILETATNDDNPSENIFYLQDFGKLMSGEHSNPMIVRNALVIARKLKDTKSIIISSHIDAIDGFVNIVLPLPSKDEHLAVIEKMVKSNPINTSELTNDGKDQIANMLVGLNESEAKKVLAYVMIDTRGLSDNNVSDIAKSKAAKLNELEALTLETDELDFNQVGGLYNLKKWVSRRKKGFTQAAKDFGLKTPKGFVALGIPGTGKSLIAKAVAKELSLPLISLDIGALFGSLVGQSEDNLRQTLAVLDTIGSCVLWLDEIDKSLSQGGEGDSGTTKRVMGKFLTWLQESDSVFVVATGNNPQTIPQELLRKGRFDETFFVDLPSTEIRKDIFKVHLSKVGKQITDYDLDTVAGLTEGFVGAEIEAVVSEALYIAFEKQTKHEKFDDTLPVIFLIEAISEIQPQSLTHSDNVNFLRNWAKNGGCRLADNPTKEQATTKQSSKPEKEISEFDLDL